MVRKSMVVAPGLGVGAELEDPADVPVGDAPRELDLALEALERRGIVRGRGADRLERHALGELEVLGLVDLAHAALRQEAQDAIAIGQDEPRPEPPRPGRERLEPVGGRCVVQGVAGLASGGRPVVRRRTRHVRARLSDKSLRGGGRFFDYRKRDLKNATVRSR